MSELRKRSEAGAPSQPAVARETPALGQEFQDPHVAAAARQIAQDAEQRAGEQAFAAAADEDTMVEVTWGEELFCPVQYNSLRIGPFKVTAKARKGESIPQAMIRIHREIQSAVAALMPEKTNSYMRELDALGKLVKRYRS